LPGELGGAKVVQASAGGAHALLLDEDGAVFAFGAASSGQLGLGETDGAFVPTAIVTTALGDRAVVQVSAGGAHSLLLADDGAVFAFGENTNGKTGRGTTSSVTPSAEAIHTTNLGGRAIAQVSAGAHHSLVLATDGTVFAFGSNADGRTGLATASGDTLVATPIDASNLGGRAIAQVSAGTAHSLLLAADGTVFSFGSNVHGVTGLGTAIGSTLVATAIDASNLAGAQVVQVAAGGNQSLLRTADGRAFSFGLNEAGATGQGTTFGTTLVAAPIDATNLAGHVVTDVAAGRSHGFVATVPEPASGAVAAALALAALAGPRSRPGRRPRRQRGSSRTK
jgi:alpha-tubulin suppressor-like RCC1 family protein